MTERRNNSVFLPPNNLSFCIYSSWMLPSDPELNYKLVYKLIINTWLMTLIRYQKIYFLLKIYIYIYMELIKKNSFIVSWSMSKYSILPHDPCTPLRLWVIMKVFTLPSFYERDRSDRVSIARYIEGCVGFS